MKLITVLGAIPQFIKASVVSAAIAVSDRLTEIVVHTGQHFDANMSDAFFTEFGMEKPACQLDIRGGSHGEMAGRILIGAEKVLLTEKPDAMLVYDVTNSNFGGFSRTPAVGGL